MNYVYATLLSTNNYLPYILGLYEGLKQVKSNYPLIVCTTPNISKNTKIFLKKLNIVVEEIPQLYYSKECIEHQKSINRNYWNNIASKLYILGLEKYEKIVCLDADMLILQNIDDLFNYPSLSSVPRKKDKDISGAVLVFKPNKKISEKIITFCLKNNLNEEETLTQYFKEWNKENEKHIPKKYNVVIDYFKKGIYIEDMKIVHFDIPKELFFTRIYFISYPKIRKYYLQYLNLIKQYIDNPI